MIKTRKGALLLIFFADTQLDCFVPICFGRVCRYKPALASDGYFYKNYRRLHLRRTDEG